MMMGSRVCWQLLLVWALLLGQPVRGMEEGQEASSEEAPSEEAPLGELPLDPSPMGDSEQPVNETSSSEEDLEAMASSERRMLEENGHHYSMLGHLKSTAMEYYNKQSHGPFYKHLEDADMTIQKAPGSILTISLFVASTNCTKLEGMPMYGPMRHFYDTETRTELEGIRCHVSPDLNEDLIEKCTFTIYEGPGYGDTVVVDHYCNPVQFIEAQPQPLEEQ